jgi:hypothetical protein
MHTPCNECGDDVLIDLQAAHYDRKTKKMGVSQSSSAAAAKEEWAHVRTLCFRCHAKETFMEAAVGDRESTARAKRQRREIVNSFIDTQFGGKCQFGECSFHVHKECPVWLRRCMHMDHQPEFDKVDAIARLVKFGPDDKLRAELPKCVPLCLPHHQLVTRFRARRSEFKAFRVRRGAEVPKEMAEAAQATVSNPKAWTCFDK